MEGIFLRFPWYTPYAAPSPMQDFVPFEQDADSANQFHDDSCGLKEIVNPADQETVVTREALAAMGLKCRSAGLTVPGTLKDILTLASKILDARAGSSTAELERLRKYVETSRLLVAAMERELLNYLTDFNELATSESTLDD